MPFSNIGLDGRGRFEEWNLTDKFFLNKIYKSNFWHVLLSYQGICSDLICINSTIFEAVIYDWHERVAYLHLVIFWIEILQENTPL